MKILFLGETYRADAITWIKGIEKASGVRIETAEIKVSKTRFGRLVNAIRFFCQLMKDRSETTYDIVLAERATSYGFFSLLVKAKIRCVAQQGITDAYPEHGIAGFYKRLIQKFVYKRVSLIHAWGIVMLEAMIHSGASPNKILLRPKGIDLDNYSFRKPILSDIPTGIVTRSLATIYHHEVILRAVQLLKDKGIQFNLIIVGDGPLRGQLERLTSKLELEDRVLFKGKIPNEKLPEYLRKSEFYISMPETEGVSASLFEAMASGCLPIVTDLRANKQFITSGKNGFLVSANDYEELSNTMLKAISEYNTLIAGLHENRSYIAQEADLEKNMAYFYSAYLAKLKAGNIERKTNQGEND